MSSVQRDGALRAWPLRIARGRLLRGSRLLLLVLAVAVLASTAVTSVGLLITATEQSAVRTSLRSISPAQTEMSVNVEQTRLSIANTEKRTDASIRTILGTAGTSTRTVRADSLPAVAALDGTHVVTYFGELGGVAQHVKLVSGSLPTSTPSKTASTIDVAIPQPAASQFALHVGSTFPFDGGSHTVTVRVAGIYQLRNPEAAFWSQDELNGLSLQSNFQLAIGDNQVTVPAFGPLISAPGTMDAIGVPADRIEIDYIPHFTTTDASDIAPLINALTTASSAVPISLGGTADQITFSGNAAAPLQQIAAALVVTRSTVVVVTLLLLVLSIAALAQAARLFNDARSGDRELMRARGSSRGQLLRVAVLEAAVVGVATALVSAPLAELVYAIIAAQPAMRAAHVPTDSGLPPSAWLTSIALGAVFIAVLLISLLGRSASFVSAEQTRSRQRRVTGLLRSGLDLGVVVIAAVAFWQLTIYKSPVGATTALSVDPVLVAAPALVLLAGTLLAARLFPLVARLVDRLGSRSSGVLFRLASWEVGRRSQRATAVVLLLTLAIAVATFSQTFLATWQQSQVDQADFAVGPAVRVPAIPAEGGAQRATLTKGAIGTPQPVLRRVADASENGAGGEDTNAVVLGLTPAARAMLDTGRLASDGGSTIAHTLKDTSQPVKGIPLPGDPVGFAATVRIGSAGQPLAGVSANVTVVLQDGAGLLSTVNLGTISVDGQSHALTAKLPTLAASTKRPLPIAIVGVQVSAFLGSEAKYVPNAPLPTYLLVGDIASLESTGGGSTRSVPAPGSATSNWGVGSEDDFDSPATRASVPGWQIALALTVPGEVAKNPAQWSETAWPSLTRIPVVVTSALAQALDLHNGTVLELNLASSQAEVEVAKITPLIPGVVDSSLLTATTAAGAASSNNNAIAIDQTALERALVQSGESGSLVDEWWVDVAPQSAAAYVAAHPSVQGSGPARSAAVLALQMQQGPLRIATEAALWLAIVAAALLAAIGFAVHSASTLTSRRIELAQLRAIGLSRRRLVGLIGVESLMQSALGVIFGVAVGVLLGLTAGPLIALSPNGTPAVPDVRVLIPWLQFLLLIAIVAIVLLAVIAAVARGQRNSNPANILREADNG